LNWLKSIEHKINIIEYNEVFKQSQINPKQFIYNVINYINNQPEEFQKKYISSFLDDCIHAYNGIVDNNSSLPNNTTSSCVKGIKERLIVNLRNGAFESNNPEYQKIAKIIGNEVIVDCIDTQKILSFASLCVTRELVEQLKTIPTIEEKKQIVIKCIMRKLKEANLVADEMQIPQSVLDAVNSFTDVLEGGYKKRRKTKNKKHKKNKTKNKKTRK
jgi:hypothetical protein